MIGFYALRAKDHLIDYLKSRDRHTLSEIKYNLQRIGQEIGSKADHARDVAFLPLVSSGARERAKHGVAPYMFWDYGPYVLLISESLRNFADKRVGQNIRWPGRYEQFAGGTCPTGEWDFEAETALFNKWADLLAIRDVDLMDEDYYKPYWDNLGQWKSVPVSWDNNGKPLAFRMDFPEKTKEVEKIQEDLQQHENAIHSLQQDILMELAENFRYLWD